MNLDKLKEGIEEVFSRLEKGHINLYHDISKEQFNFEKEKFLSSLEGKSRNEIVCGVMGLFALFKDAHTNFNFFNFKKHDVVDCEIINIDEDFFLKNGQYQKILKINGFPIEEVIDKAKNYICYEVKPYLWQELLFYLRSREFLNGLGLGGEDEIVYTTTQGDYKISKSATFTQSQDPFYQFEDENGILYVNYNKCVNMENYPFAQFVEDIKAFYKSPPKACLLDLRKNSGGNSEIINPLISYLKDNKIKTYVLMGQKTFSSGIFAVVYCKFYLDALLLGKCAGQPTKNYGEVKFDNINGELYYNYSVKYFDFAKSVEDNVKRKTFSEDVFDYIGVIKPDVELGENIDDFNRGIDSQKRDALKLIEEE